MLLERLVMPVPLVHPEHLGTDVYSLTGVSVLFKYKLKVLQVEQIWEIKKMSLALKQVFCFPVIKKERAGEKRDKFYSLMSSYVLLTSPRQLVFGARQFCAHSNCSVDAGSWCFRRYSLLPSSIEMACKARGNVLKGGEEPFLCWLQNSRKFFFLDLGNEPWVGFSSNHEHFTWTEMPECSSNCTSLVNKF